MPKEYYAKRILAFYKKNNRVPKQEEIEKPGATRRALVKHFGSWDNAVQTAIGKRAVNQRWSDAELSEILAKEIQKKIPNYVLPKDFPKKVNDICIARYGSVFGAIEKLLNDSYSLRFVVLEIIDFLTPPGVGAPTTAEIMSVLGAEKKIILPIIQLIGILKRCVTDGLLQSGKYDRLVWWELTRAGKEFLK